MRTMGWMGAASVVLCACASSPVPTEQLAKSEAAIRSAQEHGAQGVPAAALNVKVANESMGIARGFIAEGDNQRAKYILMRAEADAELAKSLAREAQVRSDAQKAMGQLQQIRNTVPEGT